jgi:DNA-binding SARP family transcriptional activator
VVRGAELAFERRPTLTELVAYLALHREGATTATWSTAVWPDRRVPMQTIANRLSEARRALGNACDGLPKLRRVADRHVLVEVSTDWGRFSQLARAGDPNGWRRALGLVRGRPFVNLRSGSWTVLEGIEGEMVSAVTSCARSLAEHLLADGDVDGASWAAHQGLRVAPWDERLHRLLMRAADAAGDRAGIDAVLRQLAVLLEIDGDPLRGVHPQTAALYAHLTTGSHAAAGGGVNAAVQLAVGASEAPA